MNLDAAIASELPVLRAEAEALMVDECTVTRAAVTGGAINEADGTVTPSSPTVVYSGPCRVQRPGTSSSRQADTGGYEVGVDTVLVQLPFSAVGVRRGDDFTVTGIGDLTDPDLLGVTAEVRANLCKTHSTKRTLICEEGN